MVNYDVGLMLQSSVNCSFGGTPLFVGSFPNVDLTDPSSMLGMSVSCNICVAAALAITALSSPVGNKLFVFSGISPGISIFFVLIF